jgi:hypothetical protein
MRSAACAGIGQGPSGGFRHGQDIEHARLMALRRRLQRLPSEPDKVIYAQTGET